MVDQYLTILKKYTTPLNIRNLKYIVSDMLILKPYIHKSFDKLSYSLLSTLTFTKVLINCNYSEGEVKRGFPWRAFSIA